MLAEFTLTLGLCAIPLKAYSTYSRFVIDKEAKTELLLKKHKNGDLYTKIEKEVKTFLDLQDDWDGYGAKPMPDIVVEHALIFISILREEKMPLPIIFPRTTEEVAFFWEDENNYIEISIGENNLSYFFETNEQVFGEENLVITEVPLKAKDIIFNITNKEKIDRKISFAKKTAGPTNTSFYTSVA